MVSSHFNNSNFCQLSKQLYDPVFFYRFATFYFSDVFFLNRFSGRLSRPEKRFKKEHFRYIKSRKSIEKQGHTTWRCVCVCVHLGLNLSHPALSQVCVCIWA